MFVFDKLSNGAEGGSKRTHNPYLPFIERLMCEVEFFGRCCVRGRYIQRFFTWADIPPAHYQIVDLEDIVYLLRCCLSYRMGKLK